MERSERIRPASWDDFDRIVELLATSPEFVRAAWALPSFEVGRDNWLAGHAGYAAVSAAGELVLAADAAPTADALLARATERARERGLEVLELRATAGGLAERHPFTLRTETLMMSRRLAASELEPVWPPETVVRTFRAEDARAVHPLLDEAYGDWDESYVPLDRDDWVRLMTGDVEFDASAWWLAERSGELSGCSLWWSSGWLKDVAVRADERRRGLGAALVGQGIAEFARRGLRRVGLRMDAANPTGARALYERLGFVVERKEQVWALNP